MQQDLKSRPEAVTLDDKWTVDGGRILLSGTQAIVRMLLAQKAIDRRNGLNTAGYISGYRGSPLGGLDTALWSIGKRLEAADILFQPGVNEDIAATAMRGTQQIDVVPGATRDGVFAAWYGKGPGVDRSGDALKHGNSAGAHAKGGVLCFYGDDHAGKSSSISHHSEQAMAAAMIPSLYPATVGEIIEYGLLGIALSRYSGCWVGIKCVNETVEQTASVDIDLDAFAPVLPPQDPPPPEGINIRLGHHLNPLRNEQVVIDHRLPLVHRFVRANGIDRTIFRAAKPKLGIITTGKSYGDTQGALALLGLTEDRAAALGISLYKVGCIWPLEQQGIVEFAAGHEVLLVVEEKQAFIEPQAASALFNAPGRPLLLGKADETGAPLLSAVLQLDPAEIARVIAGRLDRLGVVEPALQAARERSAARAIVVPANNADTPKRVPFYCSGCPHSTSTKVPEGSFAMSGIGCHAMVRYAYPEQSLTSTHMGAEGANWIGLAPFTDTKHIFQNMGDGTYYHSGSLAIRSAVAAGVNITFKILYNDAVAMTGGQPVDGPISVAEIAQQVRHEGVKTVILLSDDPSRHEGNPALPPGLRIGHRDELDGVQREMREMSGVTVLIYEQTCAAEKRRRRKRGAFPNPPKRMFISKEVCEGCGDCSVQSTCVSVTPVETEFGRKRAIDQSNCNKDYSCLKGFCPSFITVEGAEPRKPERVRIDAGLFDGLPPAAPAPITGDTFNVMVAGVGGTGVITVSAILGMAAHLEGLAVSQFDMTGLAQKNGAVYSHVRIGRTPADLRSSRMGRGEADTLLAFDLVAALADEPAGTLSRDRTRAIANSDVSQTVAFQFDRNAVVSGGLLLSRLGRLLGEDAIYSVDAAGLAMALIGDSIASNMLLLGVAAQRGALPVSVEALEQAVRLNGAAVNANLEAFRLGRLLAVRP
ncbi:MAG: indolepyruvate ferredoxin oxidoreductase, partial [Phenylobacterium sp.]|nr:indolepyruvate ferredoxin oxidoreductase [Phenylobacterium sp.]